MARVMTRTLDASVTLQDDGSESSMPDLRIDYSDGRVAFGEVVSDADPEYVQTYAELYKRNSPGFPLEITAPHLGRIWWVTVRSSHVGDLVSSVVPIVNDLEQRDCLFECATRLDAIDAADDSALQSLVHHGVVQLASRELRAAESGKVFICQDGVEGRPDPDALLGWLAWRVRADDWQDVRRKLAKCKATERHLAIVITHTTPGDAFFAVADPGSPLPNRAPDLPSAVTHLWLMPQHATGRCVAWLPTEGWADVTYPRRAPSSDALAYAGS